jgi:hypothetical protein
MMAKSGLDFFILKFISEPFRIAAAQGNNFCPEWLYWPGSLAAISKGSR